MAKKQPKTETELDSLPSKRPSKIIPVSSGMRDIYGLPFNAQLPAWFPDLYIFGRYDDIIAKGRGGSLLPKHEHFIKAAEFFWPNKKSAQAAFIWHPWAEEMLVACCYNQYVALAGSASCGKCLSPDTEVLMFDGSLKAAGDVQPGDLLMGDDSTPRTVLGTNRGRSDMYQIVPERGGEPFKCNGEHMLTLERAFAAKKSRGRVGEVIDISVRDYLRKSPTFKKSHRLICRAVEWPEQPVEVDPYVYGVWLGDGSVSRPDITLGRSKQTVLERVIEIMEGVGYAVSQKDFAGQRGVTLIRPNMGRTGKTGTSPFLDFVRRSSPGNSKVILPEYVFTSRAQRLKLLAGILDADGSLVRPSESAFDLSCSNPTLAKQITFLARSLGFRVNKSSRVTKCQGRSFPSERLNISGDIRQIPCVRHSFTPGKKHRDMTRLPFSVVPLGEGEWAGFEVDGNHRFLLSDFTVTHNSRFLAVWLLMNYKSRPTETLGLATSTTIRDSKKRIWGAIQVYYAPIKALMPYSKIIDSPTPAIYHIQDGQRIDTAGVHLIPAEAKKTNEVTGKMRGMKANGPKGRVFLAADELTELSPAVVTTALSNLVNNPTFHMVGAANPDTYYDAFALISEPKAGWQSISVEDERWDTKIGGVCVHFDALRNPNYEARENLWPIQPWEKIDEAIKSIGNKPEFWRDFRAFWCPEGVDNYVYTGQDIINNSADKKAVWVGAKKRVAGFDPSFVSGGDRGILTLGWVGITVDGLLTVEFDRYFHLAEDPHNKTEGRSFQIAKQIKDKLEEYHVPVHHFGVDSTGGGSPFSDVLANVLRTNDFLRVSFNGKASELPVSAYDSTPSHQKYANRVTEIWFYGSELIRTGQLRGLIPELAQEMTTRTYDTRRDAGTRMVVEPKPLMKARLGNSPDLADSFFILLQVARERLGLSSAEKVALSDRGGRMMDWKSEMRRFSPRPAHRLNFS